MRQVKSLLIGISTLALVTGAAFAREELSLTEPGSDVLINGYEVTSEGDVISSERFSEPMNGSESDRLVLSEPELIYEETMVFVPSVDTETPQG